MANVYQIVTQQIIEQLTAGTIPWRKPWICYGGGAYNAVTGRRYSLLNNLLLSKPGGWATFDQLKQAHCSVQKGAKSSIVVFYSWLKKTVDQAESENETADKLPKYPILRYYRVFHESQITGTLPFAGIEAKTDGPEPIVRAEDLITAYTRREHIQLVSEYSDQAYYRPSDDTIHVPLRRQFGQIEGYYSAVYHEMVHSSGAKTRLNRKGLLDIQFGSTEYAREELCAEIGAACLLRALGIDTESTLSNSSAYIAHWLDVITSSRDTRLVVVAAGQAEAAARYITGEMQQNPAAMAAGTVNIPQ